MLAIIGSTDLTASIQNDAYDVEETKEYKEWKDGNNKKHRLFYNPKVSGTIGIICGASTTISTAAFLQLLEDNSDDGVLTITVYVKNTNSMKSIECFYSLSNKMYKQVNGTDINVFELKLEEC